MTDDPLIPLSRRQRRPPAKVDRPTSIIPVIPLQTRALSRLKHGFESRWGHHIEVPRKSALVPRTRAIAPSTQETPANLRFASAVGNRFGNRPGALASWRCSSAPPTTALDGAPRTVGATLGPIDAIRFTARSSLPSVAMRQQYTREPVQGMGDGVAVREG